MELVLHTVLILGAFFIVSPLHYHTMGSLLLFLPYSGQVLLKDIIALKIPSVPQMYHDLFTVHEPHHTNF